MTNRSPQALDETSANIRKNQFDTLSFLASVSEQREFADKVFHRFCQGEFAPWWHDMFHSDELFSLDIHSASELAILKRFSRQFVAHLHAPGAEDMVFDTLQSTASWKSIETAAIAARAELKHAH